jgi:hypothetical protein
MLLAGDLFQSEHSHLIFSTNPLLALTMAGRRNSESRCAGFKE